jgi:cbb3-type cytochrome oxidase maturation protein
LTALFVVVPLALVVSFAAVWAFVWSVRHGQLDDLDTPALRMLQEDDRRPSSLDKDASQFVDDGD